LAVIFQFVDGLPDVTQCEVGFLLFIGGKRGIPPFDQFLDGADIDISVVQKTLESRHVGDEK
jgi:hypothetical protein